MKDDLTTLRAETFAIQAILTNVLFESIDRGGSRAFAPIAGTPRIENGDGVTVDLAQSNDPQPVDHFSS